MRFLKCAFVFLNLNVLQEQANNLVTMMIGNHNKTSTKAFIRNAPYSLQYAITKTGRSSLRDLTSREKKLIRMSSSSCKILAPLLVLLQQSGSNNMMDKAHEMILGVNETNIVKAEYAATYRNTSWSDDHPLDADQDMLHSLLHRWEGGNIGEGGHRGFDNAKYWLLGGSKMMNAVDESHVMRAQLKGYIMNNKKYHPEMGFVVEEEEGTRSYEIIAGSNRTRKLIVKSGEFDWIRYYNLCELSQGEKHTAIEDVGKWKDEWIEQLLELQVVEVELLLQYAVSGMR